jgi:hypothetical protein
MYNQLKLKLINGKATMIAVEPAFHVDELLYHPRRKAVSLGNLTVIYEGFVYDVCPHRRDGERQAARA